ncbi:MAG: NAD(+) synthase [Anaerolineaceae bacterium]|nr:NAD(+) synthase [Anaerolineaceae bacterium]
MNLLNFSKKSLALDAQAETQRIIESLRETVNQRLHRQGAVIGISGGIDSSVVLALAARAFGPERVVGLLLPEKESSPESAELALELAAAFGVEPVTENITATLEGAGCYQRRDEAIQRVFPQYQPGWKAKIVLPGDLLDQGTLNIFHLVVTGPDGVEMRQRLPLREYYQIVASSNFKQRTRTNMEYYHAELRNYAVIGTPNKNEHDLGFFVKGGDGLYDIAPIRHLFKTQVYQLAEHLGVPASICSRPPTTDTYPGGGTQEEFFYRIPYDLLDTIWLGFEQGLVAAEIAAALDLTAEQVARVEQDIVRKQKTTAYLRSAPLGVE